MKVEGISTRVSSENPPVETGSPRTSNQSGFNDDHVSKDTLSPPRLSPTARAPGSRCRLSRGSWSDNGPELNRNPWWTCWVHSCRCCWWPSHGRCSCSMGVDGNWQSSWSWGPGVRSCGTLQVRPSTCYSTRSVLGFGHACQYITSVISTLVTFIYTCLFRQTLFCIYLFVYLFFISL